MTEDIDLFGETVTPTIIDRSTLEPWAVCPRQALMIERRMVRTSSPDTDSGNIVHDAISAMTHEVYAGRLNSVVDGAEMIRQHIMKSRPDLQQHALDAVAFSAWSIARLVLFQDSGEPRSPEDIMAFDGGPAEARGQLATDIEHGGKAYRLTCEVDLLLATVSQECAELDDYKTGHALWDAEDVHASFQFGTFYPCLVFANYPGLQRLRVRVFDTRRNSVTPAIEYRREKFLPAAWARITAALDTRAKWIDARDMGAVPAYPKSSECYCCPAVRECADAEPDIVDVATDPGRVAARLIVLEKRCDQYRAALNKHVDAHGEIYINETERYGREKPRSTKKSPATIYTIKEDK